jgi:hypothetical protein
MSKDQLNNILNSSASYYLGAKNNYKAKIFSIGVIMTTILILF